MEIRAELSEWFIVKDSGVHGLGLFAAKDIPRGTWIVEYGGRLVGKREGTRLTQLQWEKGHVTVFSLNSRWDVDGSPAWNVPRLCNHSCDPNAESQVEKSRRIWIVANRRIPEGQEITYDYGFEFVDPPAPCRCGSPKCLGYLIGEDHRHELRAWLLAHGKPVPAALRRLKKKSTHKRPATGRRRR